MGTEPYATHSSNEDMARSRPRALTSPVASRSASSSLKSWVVFTTSVHWEVQTCESLRFARSGVDALTCCLKACLEACEAAESCILGSRRRRPSPEAEHLSGSVPSRLTPAQMMPTAANPSRHTITRHALWLPELERDGIRAREAVGNEPRSTARRSPSASRAAPRK